THPHPRPSPIEGEGSLITALSPAPSGSSVAGNRRTRRREERHAMALNALHHITVMTKDLDATRDFYRDILGLTEGFRPELPFPGYWLYCGETPVVHLVPNTN